MTDFYVNIYNICFQCYKYEVFELSPPSHSVKRGKCRLCPCMWPPRDHTVSLLQDQCQSSSRSKGKAAFIPLLASVLGVHDLRNIRPAMGTKFWAIIQEMALVAVMTHIPPPWIIKPLPVLFIHLPFRSLFLRAVRSGLSTPYVQRLI